jgi:two-component system LytT family response regulator
VARQKEANILPPNIQELLAQVNGPSKAKLLINSKEGMEYVELNDIVLLESDSNYTFLHLQDGRKILSPRTLKDYELELAGLNDFMRVHHSFVINLQKVTRYLKSSEEIVLQNDRRIPVSKSRKLNFLEWLEK